MADVDAGLVLQQEGSKDQDLDTLSELRAQLRQQSDQLAAQEIVIRELRAQLKQQGDHLAAQESRYALLLHAFKQLYALFPKRTKEVTKDSYTRVAQAEAATSGVKAAAAAPGPSAAAPAEAAVAEAVDTAAAAAAAARLFEQFVDAMCMLLQHQDHRHGCTCCNSRPCFKVVSPLLQTTKALQLPIHEICRGQLSVNGKVPVQAVPWITKHGSLLKSLSGPCPNSQVLSALSALHSSSLTSLDLSSSAAAEEWLESAAAIAGMTALCSLKLTQPKAGHLTHGADRMAIMASSLLPLLGSFNQLTTLYIDNVTSAADLKHLPPQLQQLKVNFSLTAAAGQLFELGHVTALTTLEVPNGRFVTGSVLPASLQLLKVLKCTTVQPILLLQQVQVLELGDCYVPLSQLHQLTSLTSLDDLRLSRTSWGKDANAAAAVWSVLPFRVLKLGSFNTPLTLSAVQQLGECQGLTRLEMCDTPVMPATVAQLAEALGQLTQLKVMNMEGDVGHFTVAAMAAASVLEELVCHDMRGWFPLDHLPAEDNTAAHMTRLDLVNSRLSVPEATAIASHCTAVQHLDLRGNQLVNEAAVSAIVQQLTQLTYLNLEETSVTDVSVLQLSSLVHLQELRMNVTEVSAVAVALQQGSPA